MKRVSEDAVDVNGEGKRNHDAGCDGETVLLASIQKMALNIPNGISI